MKMNWNEFAADVHQNAVDRGWWDPKPSVAQIVVMCHSELSKAVEEYRAGRPMVYRMCETSDKTPCDLDVTGVCAYAPSGPCEYRGAKPEGVAVEMGDCILRILDYLAEAGVDIDGSLIFATPAPKDLIEAIAQCHSYIAAAYVFRDDDDPASFKNDLRWCLETILDWARQNNVDMEAVLRAKHAYNKTRPYRHGGKKF